MPRAISSAISTRRRVSSTGGFGDLHGMPTVEFSAPGVMTAGYRTKKGLLLDRFCRP